MIIDNISLGFHPALLPLGRLRYSVSLLRIDPFIYRLIHYIIKVKEIHNFSTYNRLRRTRLYEIGIIEKDIRLFYGITGLLSRSAKIGIDARLIGHELHHKLSYTLYLPSSGDRTDRYIPRFNEIIETNKINYLCLCLLLLGYLLLIGTIDLLADIIFEDYVNSLY